MIGMTVGPLQSCTMTTARLKSAASMNAVSTVACDAGRKSLRQRMVSRAIRLDKHLHQRQCRCLQIPLALVSLTEEQTSYRQELRVLFDEGDERVDGDVAGAEILNQSHEARSVRTWSAASMPWHLGQKPGEVTAAMLAWTQPRFGNPPSNQPRGEGPDELLHSVLHNSGH